MANKNIFNRQGGGKWWWGNETTAFEHQYKNKKKGDDIMSGEQEKWTLGRTIPEAKTQRQNI